MATAVKNPLLQAWMMIPHSPRLSSIRSLRSCYLIQHHAYIIKKILSQNLAKLQSNSSLSSFPAYMQVQDMDY
jgi:hypothetical protein